MIDATTLLFGLPGLQVANVTRCDDGTRIVDAVTGHAIAGAYPWVFSTSVKQYARTVPKAFPTVAISFTNVNAHPKTVASSSFSHGPCM